MRGEAGCGLSGVGLDREEDSHRFADHDGDEAKQCGGDSGNELEEVLLAKRMLGKMGFNDSFPRDEIKQPHDDEEPAKEPEELRDNGENGK